MDAVALKNWMTHQLALRVAETAISTLERTGIRALPVKGLLLAQQVYDSTERPIADIDLIIPPADFRRALQVARTKRWEIVWDSRTLGSVNFIVDGMAIDVMSSFGPAGISALRVPALFSRSTCAIKPLGFPHWQIEQHDHALLLALDAFKDKLGSGKRWAREDLLRVVKREGFEPATLVNRAADASLLTMLAIVADWVVSVYPAPPWIAVQLQLSRVALRSGYHERYKKLLEAPTTSAWGRWRLSVSTRAVSDSPTRRLLAIILGAIGAAKFVMRHGGLRVNPWEVRRSAGGR